MPMRSWAGASGPQCARWGGFGSRVRKDHPEEELYFTDGEHSSVLGASLAGAVIGRTLLGMDLSPVLCFEDAKALETLSLDPRMLDLVVEGGGLKLKPLAGHP